MRGGLRHFGFGWREERALHGVWAYGKENELDIGRSSRRAFLLWPRRVNRLHLAEKRIATRPFIVRSTRDSLAL